jgi:hypothetical protein
MNFSPAWIVTAVDAVADFARSGLPWNYRQAASNWMVFGVILLLLAILFFAIHFFTQEKPKISWNFENTGYPVRLSWSRDATRNVTYYVDGVEFGGENVSGHTLHQIDAEIKLLRDNQRVPTFVVINGAWHNLNELGSVPPRAMLFLGLGFRSDGLHLPSFSQKMTPDQFLRDFGGFTFSTTIDGDQKSWSFTIEELRRQFEAQERESEDQWFKNPINRPQVKLKPQS